MISHLNRAIFPAINGDTCIRGLKRLPLDISLDVLMHAVAPDVSSLSQDASPLPTAGNQRQRRRVMSGSYPGKQEQLRPFWSLYVTLSYC